MSNVTTFPALTLNAQYRHRDGSAVPADVTLRLGKTKVSGSYTTGARYCSRCGGTGVYTYYSHWHRVDGVCFLCNGDPKLVETKVYTPKRLEQLNRAEAKREAKRVAKFEQVKAEKALRASVQFASFSEEYATLLAAAKVSTNELVSKFLDSLASFGRLTTKQIVWLDIVLADEYVKAHTAPSRHVGAIGDRIELAGTITFVKDFNGVYGTTYLTTITSDDGNTFIQFGAWIGEKGDRIAGKATVKEHTEYRDVAQTKVCRFRANKKAA